MDGNLTLALILLLILTILMVDTGKNYFLGYGYYDYPFENEPDFNKKYIENFNLNKSKNIYRYITYKKNKYKNPIIVKCFLPFPQKAAMIPNLLSGNGINNWN